MNRPYLLPMAALAAGLVLVPATASAESCWDLWYERNAIYDANGFCFSTSLGQRTFDNSDCWTRKPALKPGEQRRVDRIRTEERRRGCKVN